MVRAEHPHWHIDYLRKYARLVSVWYRSGARCEHSWAAQLRAIPGKTVPMAGFGSSDCRCAAHLFGLVNGAREILGQLSAYPEIMASFPPTTRTQVKRLPQRALYSQDEIYTILDEGFLCHIGFVVDGQPYVIPTTYARRGSEIFIHGSAASRMLRTLGVGVDVCVTVTLVDGFVLARSAFHHSINYRSVVILGKARVVTDPAEKLEALRCFTNHMVRERWDEVRQPTEHELKTTAVLALPLAEVSAKVRQGPPVDDEEDRALPVWAGVVPLRAVVGAPVAADDLAVGTPQFDVKRFARFA